MNLEDNTARYIIDYKCNNYITGYDDYIVDYIIKLLLLEKEVLGVANNILSALAISNGLVDTHYNGVNKYLSYDDYVSKFKNSLTNSSYELNVTPLKSLVMCDTIGSSLISFIEFFKQMEIKLGYEKKLTEDDISFLISLFNEATTSY